jgi:hypothetical protein
MLLLLWVLEFLPRQSNKLREAKFQNTEKIGLSSSASHGAHHGDGTFAFNLAAESTVAGGKTHAGGMLSASRATVRPSASQSHRAGADQHLALANRHIAELHVQIVRQRVIVKHALDTDRRPEMAESLLDALEESLRGACTISLSVPVQMPAQLLCGRQYLRKRWRRPRVAALPFEFPRLAVTAFVPPGGGYAEQLDARLRRFAERKLIEAKPIKEAEKVDARRVTDLTLPPPIPDRRFRRRV